MFALSARPSIIHEALVHRSGSPSDDQKNGLRIVVGHFHNYNACAESSPAGNHAEKDEPQPQVEVAFGLRITNCDPSRPSE